MTLLASSYAVPTITITIIIAILQKKELTLEIVGNLLKDTQLTDNKPGNTANLSDFRVQVPNHSLNFCNSLIGLEHKVLGKMEGSENKAQEIK